MFGIFAVLAEFERELIRERSVAGLKAARARGHKGCRKFALSEAQVRLAQAAMAHRDAARLASSQPPAVELGGDLAESRGVDAARVRPRGPRDELGRDLGAGAARGRERAGPRRGGRPARWELRV